MWWPATLDQVGLLMIFLALLPWVIPYLRANFKSVEAVGIKLDLIERKVDDQAKRIDELYLLSTGEKVFTHLRKLGDPEYGACFVGTALPRELGYLEALGFIRFRGKLKGLDDFLEQFNGREAPNLSDYIDNRNGKSVFGTAKGGHSRASHLIGLKLHERGA